MLTVIFPADRMIPVLISRFYLNLDEVRRAEDRKKAEQECQADLERAKSWRLKVRPSLWAHRRQSLMISSQPLPPLPDFECSDKIHYAEEVFQYNGRLRRNTVVFL